MLPCRAAGAGAGGEEAEAEDEEEEVEAARLGARRFGFARFLPRGGGGELRGPRVLSPSADSSISYEDDGESKMASESSDSATE